MTANASLADGILHRHCSTVPKGSRRAGQRRNTKRQANTRRADRSIEADSMIASELVHGDRRGQLFGSEKFDQMPVMGKEQYLCLLAQVRE